MNSDLFEWFITSSPSGQQLRRIAERLENWDIEEHPQYRQGTPEQQIQSALEEGDYERFAGYSKIYRSVTTT